MEKGVEGIRLSSDIRPEMYRCATVSRAELDELRGMQNIVRLGRVVSITPDEVTLQRGSYKPLPGALYVDCSADGLAKLPPVPVFQGRTLRLQPVRPCQQVFSAAFIAHVESAYQDETLKNELCRPVPHPNVAADWSVTSILYLRARALWNAHPETMAWLVGSRLNFETQFLPADQSAAGCAAGQRGVS